MFHAYEGGKVLCHLVIVCERALTVSNSEQIHRIASFDLPTVRRVLHLRL